MAYTAWVGGNLPTEAQWEAAARGKEGRKYPWADNTEPTCEHVNFGVCGDALKPVKPPREKGKTPEGVYDLAGNAWEWCQDWGHSPSRAGSRLAPTERTPEIRVLRGSAFDDFAWDTSDIWTNFASTPEPNPPQETFGFRVVFADSREVPRP